MCPYCSQAVYKLFQYLTQPGHPSVDKHIEYQQKLLSKQARCAMHRSCIHGHSSHMLISGQDKHHHLGGPCGLLTTLHCLFCNMLIADHRDDQANLWNPMEEDYLSERNSYKVDVDDPGVATVGYSKLLHLTSNVNHFTTVAFTALRRDTASVTYIQKKLGQQILCS